jgi:molybdopterin/thiamine biosynthesis adenylyltransferase/rhodanese-related sulfurtransferase
MDDYYQLLSAARDRILEVTGDQLGSPASLLIDIREPHELATGTIPGAVAVPMRDLPGRIAQLAPDTAQPIVLYCAVGERSAIAAAALQEHGYTAVASLAGGITRWMEEGRALAADDGLSPKQHRRYSRQMVIPGIGVAGQRRLLESRIAVVGAGGLGSPTALYLAAAGVGTVGIIDHDTVDLSNLQRQIIHATADVGRAKTASAADRITALNPDVTVVPVAERLTAANAIEALTGFDLIVDATDNFATRYLLTDVSMHLRAPVVHGSIFRFEGQVTVFAPYQGPCYRCVFPAPPPPQLAPNCAEAGVFGVLPGVIGSLQATEALKLVLGIGTPLIGTLLTYDALDGSTFRLQIDRRPHCESCGDEENPPPLRDEADYC